MNKAQVFPLTTEYRQKLLNAKKDNKESMTQFVNRMMSYKQVLVDAGQVYADDSDVIGCILAALDHTVYGTIQDQVANDPLARTKISALLPILNNNEAMLRISEQKHGSSTPKPASNQKSSKKNDYGMFGSYAHRGGRHGRGRGRGRNTQNGRDTHAQHDQRRCWICNSTEHLAAQCPDRVTAPPASSAPAHRGGRNSNRGGSQRGRGRTMLHAYAQHQHTESDEREPKRARVEEQHNQYYPPPASSEGPHTKPWRE